MSAWRHWRRGWPWAVALAAVFALPFAWPYRPLNRTERQLAGTWLVTHDTGKHTSIALYVLTPDRRYVSHFVRGGPSEASGQVWIGNWTATATTRSASDSPSARSFRDFATWSFRRSPQSP